MNSSILKVLAACSLLVAATAPAQDTGSTAARDESTPAPQETAAPAAQNTAPPAARSAGSPAVARLCSICHSDSFASTAAGPHALLDTDEWREEHASGLSCLACHGDVSEHMATRGQGEVFAFRGESPRRVIDTCLGCHADTHPQFDSSPHARAGVACIDCHSQHDASRTSAVLLRDAPGEARNVGEISALCAGCHAEKLAEFALNERHSLDTVQCTSCHNPHAPATRRLLGAFKHDVCTSCHLDKEGPFVFEHPASRVEGCTACHSPHGSPNRHLLNHQNVAELCISCHAAIPQFHLGFSPVGPPRFSLETRCTNCHTAIHGSNLHERFLR